MQHFFKNETKNGLFDRRMGVENGPIIGPLEWSPPHKSSKMAKSINVLLTKSKELIRPLELQKFRGEPAGAQKITKKRCVLPG